MLQVINDRVAIVPIENPDMIGSLYIPDIAKDRLNQGFVKYKGPEVRDLKIGDYVLFSGYSGTLTFVEGEGKFIIMPEDFVVAVIDLGNRRWEIPGLYFKDRFNRDAHRIRLFEIIGDALPDLDEAQAMDLAEKLVLRGGRVEDTLEYFPADYETTMNYFALALGENKEFREILRVSNLIPGTHDLQKPTEADYDKLKTGAGSRD